MDAANTVIEAALVHADEDAAVRLQVVEIIRAVVHEELTRLIQAAVNGTKAYSHAANPFETLASVTISSHEYDIKRIAMRAVKEHFNNSQQIY
jgi:hypothetical protein